MKHQTPRFPAILLVLTLIPIPFLPQGAASHLSWSTLVNIDSTAATVSHSRFTKLDNDTFIVADWEGDTNDRLISNRCKISTKQCTTSVMLDIANNGGGADIYAATASIIYGCAADQVTDDLHVARSGNGGTLWSSNQAMTTVLADPAPCAVASFSGTNVMAVAGNVGTTAALQFVHSTDSGQTWSTIAAVEATTAAAATEIDLVALGATTYSLVYVTSAFALRECYTTDAAAWTCRTMTSVSSAIGNGLFLTTLDGSLYLCSADDTTDDVTFAFLDVLAGVWVTSSAVNLASAMIGSCSIAVFDVNTVAIVYQTNPTGDSVSPSWYTESLDGGATWSTPEATTPGLDVAASDYRGAGVMFQDEVSEVVAAYAYQRDADDNDLSSNDVDSWKVVSSLVSAALVSSATASVTNLVGFDVDPTGTTAVARTYGGDCVEIWGAKTLGNLAQCPVTSSVETDCDLGFYEDAVAVKHGGELVMFLNCDTSGDPEFLSIRGLTGDVPSSNDLSGCSPGSVDTQCPYDIDITEAGWGQFDDVGQIGQIKDFPVDYSAKRDNFFLEPGYLLSWAFSTQDPDPGELGVATFVRRDGAVDGNEEETVQYSGSVVEDFCVGLDGGQYYLAGADSAFPIKTWEFTYTEDSVPQWDLVVTIDGPDTFGTAGGIGIACGGGQVAFVTSNNQLYYATRTSEVLDSVALGDTVPRGVAITEEFDAAGENCLDAVNDEDCYQFVLAWDDDETNQVQVYDTQGGQLTHMGELAVDADGSFKDLIVDRVGNWAWTAQTGQVDGFEIFTITTGNETGSPCIINCGDGQDDVSDGLFGDNVEAAGEAIGISNFGANLLFGSILMGLVAYGVGTGYGNLDSNAQGNRALRVNPWAAAVGAAVGFLLAWGFGFFTTAVVFSMVVLIGMVVGIRIWTSRS